MTDVLFVVKSAAPGWNSKIVLALTVNTVQGTYNAWGGTSLYSTPRALRVSFHRPGGLVDTFRTFGESRFIAWRPERLRAGILYEHRPACGLAPWATISSSSASGMMKYRSKEMRDNVEAFIANGGNVVFFQRQCLLVAGAV